MAELHARTDDPPLPVPRLVPVTADEFQECFNETLLQTLDLDSWREGIDLVREHARVEAQIEQAVNFED